MKRRSLLKTIAAAPATLLTAPASRTWLGPDYWANPLQDWRKTGDHFECHAAGGDRNVYWLTKEIGSLPFKMSVQLGRLGQANGPSWAGFRFGMNGHFADYRDTAIRGLGIEAGVGSDGRLFVGKAGSGPVVDSLDDLTLTLERTGTRVRLSAGTKSMEENIAAASIAGGVALVCHSGDLPSELPSRAEPQQASSGKPSQQRGGAMRCWFRDWKLTGDGVSTHPERAWGPILFTQYTVSAGTLKMTVQLAPCEGDEREVELKLGQTHKAKIEAYSSTAHFRIEGWQAARDAPYELRFGRQIYKGAIRRDPNNKNEIVVGALTCQGDFGFPHSQIAKNMTQVKPDVLFFTGDQLYEANGGYGIQRGPSESARLDYLRKWYMFGWAWGELTRNTPCICLPDDHDVYHGNLWGAGGRAAQRPVNEQEPSAVQQGTQDSGGYQMPATWVNMVQRTQSSHLPDSPDPSKVDQGVTVHYGRLVWGGIDFAILEDRKWKSAPKTLMPDARIRNGWPQNPEWNGAKQGDVAGAQLLGPRQEKFLEDWAQSWPESVEMKAAVSATIFCNLATLPKSTMSDAGTPKLPILPAGGYAQDEKLTQDHDSNGWPQTPRNRALRSLRSCLAVHIAGDQHLASTVQYGIDDWNDGPYAICTPAISNIFPRRWYPGGGKNTGEFSDGFGNKITVHAIANPQQFGIAPKALNERAPGFGVVVFDKRARKIRLTNYPRWADLSKNDKSYPGWPIVIDQADNGLKRARWELHLPEKVSGLIRVMQAGKSILTWRAAAPTDRIRLWSEGEYDVAATSRTIKGVKAVRV